MSKKWKGLIAVLACLLVLTACGGAAPAAQEEISDDLKSELFGNTEMAIQSIDEIVSSGSIEDWSDNAAIYAGLQSWISAKDEIGAVDFTQDADGNGVADSLTEKSAVADEDGNYIVTVGVSGAQRNADFVTTYTKDLSDIVSITTNVEYTFGELMQQAGLNTVLGMGTTFAVLILLSLIIALFGSVMSSRSKKKAEAEAAKEEMEKQSAVSATNAVVSTAQGSLAAQEDNGALVAVIAAAIAAYRSEAEPAADPEDFVVRRIHRIHRR